MSFSLSYTTSKSISHSSEQSILPYNHTPHLWRNKYIGQLRWLNKGYYNKENAQRKEWMIGIVKRPLTKESLLSLMGALRNAYVRAGWSFVVIYFQGNRLMFGLRWFLNCCHFWGAQGSDKHFQGHHCSSIRLLYNICIDSIFHPCSHLVFDIYRS